MTAAQPLCDPITPAKHRNSVAPRPAPAVERGAQRVLAAATESAAAAELGRVVKKVRAYLQQVQRDILALEANGRRQAAKEARFRLVRSFALKLHAADRAARALNRKRSGVRSGEEKISAKDVVELARRLNLGREPAGKVAVLAIPKRGKDAPLHASLTEANRDPAAYRYVCSFDFEHRARQYALKCLAETSNAAVSVAEQYPNIPNGFIRMQEDILARLNAGDVFVIKSDIRNCYRNVNPDGLHRDIGITRGMFDNNARISAERLRFAGVKGGARQRRNQSRPMTLADAYMNDTIEEHAKRLAPEGLVQGSAVSPKLAQIALRHLPGKLPAGVQLVQWVDDMLILAPSKKQASDAQRTLRAALRSGELHGQFEVTASRVGVVDGRHDIEFCGVVYGCHQGRFYARPSRQKLLHCERKIKASAMLGAADPRHLERAVVILDGFLRNYPFWPAARLWRARMMQDVEAARFLRHWRSTVPSVSRSITPPVSAGRAYGMRRARPSAGAHRALRVLASIVEPRCKRGTCDDPDEVRPSFIQRLVREAA